MRRIIFSYLLLQAAVAMAASPTLETLRVTDVSSLQTCYSIRPYELKTRTGAVTTQIVDEDTIARQCTRRAVGLAREKPSDRMLLLELAEEVRKNHRPESSLRVFRVLVENDGSHASCENSEVYAALMQALRHPADYPSATDSDLKVAYSVLDACLKNPQFVTDIRADAGAGKPYVSENLCSYLKARNSTPLPESCKS